MKNVLLLAIMLLCLTAGCRKDKNCEEELGKCNTPVERYAVVKDDFNGQFFHVKSYKQDGEKITLQTNGSCVSEPKNTVLLFDYSERLPSFPIYEYALYLADTVRNDFTMDCYTTKPMTLCFDLASLLPAAGGSNISYKNFSRRLGFSTHLYN